MSIFNSSSILGGAHSAFDLREFDRQASHCYPCGHCRVTNGAPVSEPVHTHELAVSESDCCEFQPHTNPQHPCVSGHATSCFASVTVSEVCRHCRGNLCDTVLFAMKRAKGPRCHQSLGVCEPSRLHDRPCLGRKGKGLCTFSLPWSPTCVVHPAYFSQHYSHQQLPVLLENFF